MKTLSLLNKHRPLPSWLVGQCVQTLRGGWEDARTCYNTRAVTPVLMGVYKPHHWPQLAVSGVKASADVVKTQQAKRRETCDKTTTALAVCPHYFLSKYLTLLIKTQKMIFFNWTSFNVVFLLMVFLSDVSRSLEAKHETYARGWGGGRPVSWKSYRPADPRVPGIVVTLDCDQRHLYTRKHTQSIPVTWFGPRV